MAAVQTREVRGHKRRKTQLRDASYGQRTSGFYGANKSAYTASEDSQQLYGGSLPKYTTNGPLLKCSRLVVVVVCRLHNAPATCECISGTDLLRQVYVLPH